MNKTMILTLICLMMFNNIFSESDITKKKDEYCSKNSLNDINLSDDELKDLRDEKDNTFTDNFLDIMDFMQDPKNNSDDLFDSFKAPGILLIILIATMFISLIVFCGLCCGCCTTEDNKVKTCTTLACIMFFVFAILFIVILVYLGYSQDNVDDVVCAQFKIPSAIIDGNDDENNKFVGLTNLKSTLSSFKVLLESQLNVLSQNFSNIRNTNIQTKTNSVWNKLADFVNNSKTLKITDAEGLSKTPNSILNMTKGLNVQIESDFTNIDVIAERLTVAAQAGEQFSGSSTQRENTTNMLNIVDSSLANLIEEIENVTKPGTDNIDTYIDYVLAGYWCVFAFAIVLILLSLIVLCMMCNMCKNNKCWNNLKCARVLLVFIGFFILMFGIIVFILLVGSATVSGFCGFVGQINSGDKDVLDDFTELNADVKTIIETCLYRDSTGNLNDLVIKDKNLDNNNYLNSIYDFIDGFSTYRFYRNNDASSLASNGIIEQTKVWDRLELAKSYDLDNINSGLEELNNLISCDNKSFQFYSSDCDNKSGCSAILDRDAYIAPSCANVKANKLFANLKLYITEEITLMNKFQLEVSDQDNSQSVQSQYILAKEGLNGLNQEVVEVEKEFKTVFDNSTNKFAAKWKDIDDCRALRKILLQYEDKTCFEFNYWIYILLCVSSVISVLLLLMAWCMCCGLRTKGESDEEPEEIDVDGGEKKPFY